MLCLNQNRPICVAICFGKLTWLSLLLSSSVFFSSLSLSLSLYFRFSLPGRHRRRHLPTTPTRRCRWTWKFHRVTVKKKTTTTMMMAWMGKKSSIWTILSGWRWTSIILHLMWSVFVGLCWVVSLLFPILSSALLVSAHFDRTQFPTHSFILFIASFMPTWLLSKALRLHS